MRRLITALLIPVAFSTPLITRIAAALPPPQAVPAAHGQAGLQLPNSCPSNATKFRISTLIRSLSKAIRPTISRDWIATIERMKLASQRLPDLADYALYYQASAERQNGDAPAASADFSLLATDYPLSVWANTARLGYAQIELAAGRPDLALASARAVTARNAAPGTDQQARLIIAQALQAQGDDRGAYAAAQELRQLYPQGANDAAARALAYQTTCRPIQTSPIPSRSVICAMRRLCCCARASHRWRSKKSMMLWRSARRFHFAPNCYGFRRAPRTALPPAKGPP